jgi:Fe-Mn family superoxide dismutase
MNLWINEFNIGELICVDLLLVMDMWEHAYLCEFGLDINKYHEIFLKNVNWSVVSKYFNRSLGL